VTVRRAVRLAGLVMFGLTVLGLWVNILLLDGGNGNVYLALLMGLLVGLAGFVVGELGGEMA